MKKISNFIVKYHLILLIVFAVCIVISCIFIPKVNINNDITKYLPKGSPSVEALDKLTDAFGGQTSTQIMIENITTEQANQIKEQLADISGINSVVYDETNNYKNNSALFVVNMDYYGYSAEARYVLEDIQQILSDYNIYLSGDVISSSYMDEIMSKNMPIILIIAGIIILSILFITSTSWVDPLVFAIILGGAIAINLGTNALLPDVSFVTNSICIIMQLALAMDYSIMFLHRFNEEKQKTTNIKQALSTALSRTFKLVLSSSFTTIASLIALMFMQFTIGLDVGIVLAKGILISMLCVFLFMPGVLLIFSKLLEKTKHRSLHSLILNSINKRYNKKYEQNTIYDQNFAEALSKGTKPEVYKAKKIWTFAGFQKATRFIIPCIVVIAIALGTYFQQANLQYTYNIDTATDKNAAVNTDIKKIQDTFGLQNALVVMVPWGDYEKELLIEDYITNYEQDGESIISSSFAFINTGLIDLYSANDLATQFNLPQFLVNQVFSIMQKDPETDSVVLIDFLQNASTSQIIVQDLQPVQTTIDNLYGQAAPLFNKLTAQEFADTYGLEITYVEDIWTDLGQPFNTAIEAHTIIALMLDSSTPPIGDPLISARFMMLYAIYQIANIEVINITDILEGLNVPEETIVMINQIIEELNLPPINTAYELFEYLSKNQIIIQLATNYQQEIDNAYLAANTARKTFETEKYSRLIFNLNLPIADQNAFTFVESLRAHVATLYSESYIAGSTPTMFDISETFNSDVVTINLIAFFAILIILLLSFRSISISVLLTALIQGAIFITMGTNALLGSPIFFICYLLVMCIQMGATIDYAILLSSRYIEARKTHDKYKSAAIALERSITTILTSGLILTLSSLTVGFVSGVALISAFGQLLGFGCLVSMFLIIFTLPQILMLCDKFIAKTTYKSNFTTNKTPQPLYVGYKYAKKPKKQNNTLNKKTTD